MEMMKTIIDFLVLVALKAGNKELSKRQKKGLNIGVIAIINYKRTP
jgi:hypothetical protein